MTMSYFTSNDWGKSQYQDLSNSRVHSGKLELGPHFGEETCGEDKRYDSPLLASLLNESHLLKRARFINYYILFFSALRRQQQAA